ncbi:threonylcarbamoyl-AMP synthase [Allostella humosa]|nr:L-threonylcarbamoyladenylate synthase [Stella humosa]BBK30025.1 threonylcarbamoyl-AMP synthase [Stella humosa]
MPARDHPSPAIIQRPDPATIAEGARLLAEGRLVAFPTETVYGLGGDASSDAAVARIFQAKGRPRFNPLIAHVHDLAAARRIARLDARAEAVAKRFWPGPLTLVLPRRPEGAVSLLATAGLDTVAVRIPAHPVALALLEAAGRPVAGPSANPSGGVSPTTARHVADGLGQAVAMILDGGDCRVGVESTVLDLSGEAPTLLRPGGLARTLLEAALGCHLGTAVHGDPTRPTAPGQLASHYAPGRPVRLNATAVAADEALLAFGPEVPTGAAVTLQLSRSGDLAEAAANLFAHLRALDRPDLRAIAVQPIPETGLGEAINDRLRRAAAPRDDVPATFD